MQGSGGLTGVLPRLTGAKEVDCCGKRVWRYSSRGHSACWWRPVSSPWDGGRKNSSKMRKTKELAELYCLDLHKVSDPIDSVPVTYRIGACHRLTGRTPVGGLVRDTTQKTSKGQRLTWKE